MATIVPSRTRIVTTLATGAPRSWNDGRVASPLRALSTKTMWEARIETHVPAMPIAARFMTTSKALDGYR